MNGKELFQDFELCRQVDDIKSCKRFSRSVGLEPTLPEGI